MILSSRESDPGGERKVLDLIEANRQEIIDFLRELLAFETITPDAQHVEHGRPEGLV